MAPKDTYNFTTTTPNIEVPKSFLGSGPKCMQGLGGIGSYLQYNFPIQTARSRLRPSVAVRSRGLQKHKLDSIGLSASVALSY